MYEEFKELYHEMRSELLISVRASRLVMARVKDSDEITDCILWLRMVRSSPEYIVAKQRLKEVSDDMLTRYKAQGMMDFPEIAYRKKAFKDLRNMWDNSMPSILRRTNGKKANT